MERIFLLSLFFVSAVNAHWSYKSGNGTHGWHGECEHGKSQSPINIAPSRATKVYLRDHLKFEHYNELPAVERLVNNGHSVTMTLEEDEDSLFPKVSQGGLPGVFQFSQFHFHWGSEDEKGSEHTVEGERAPMELHLVHFNLAYGNDIVEALEKSNHAWDTLAVLGVLFEIQEEDNHNFDHIVEELKYVQYLDQEVSNVTVFPLMKVLPNDTHRFFRYNGSLTTPPCSEIVIWTIFKETVKISENQLNRFRDLVDVDETEEVKETESDNFREPQPLNHRPFLDITTTSGVCNHVVPVAPLIIISMFSFMNIAQKYL